MDTVIDIRRLDDATKDLEQAMKDNPPQPGGILFYGSSTITGWRTNNLDKRQMAPLPIVNNGFGGSTAEEALFFYHRLVRPAKPSIILFYEGANDLNSGYTPQGVVETTHRIFEWARQDFPGIQFALMPVKHCPALKHISHSITLCNELFSDYAAAHEDTHMIDLKPLIFDDNGDMRMDIYVEDRLHHNAKGYDLLAAQVKPVLEKLYAGREQATAGA